MDKTLSRYAIENSISNFEFLSCIPGSLGGTIRMNSGCYGNEISNILISINALDFRGNLIEIKRDDIQFNYRGSSLPEDLIFCLLNFKRKKGEKTIKEKVEKYSQEKKKKRVPAKSN